MRFKRLALTMFKFAGYKIFQYSYRLYRYETNMIVYKSIKDAEPDLVMYILSAGPGTTYRVVRVTREDVLIDEEHNGPRALKDCTPWP